MSFMKDFDHLRIQMKDILRATNNFDPAMVIGRGGFGYVYKGELYSPAGKITVAFKRLDRRLGQGKVEFWKEVMMLSKYKHENLITLLHFCIDGDQMVLVYEYASRGSLDRYLNDPVTLPWIQRLKISVGAARGLQFLHDPKSTQLRVLHRDVKSANILLDENWMAKVSDFGLSKLGPASQGHSYLISHSVGTPGYCDPLYMEFGFLSKESDVYSLGVVLFEILCGRLCYEYWNHELSNILVPEWRRCYEEKKLDEIILPGLKEQMDLGSLRSFAAIAYQCVKKAREERPTMAEVVKELEFSLAQQMMSFMKDFGRLRIQMTDILLATNNFDPAMVIGGGGFGNVYKGELSSPKGQTTLAFKRLDRCQGQDKVDFLKEVMMLSKYKHENLITLLDCCIDGDQMVLVYEYASRGSLDRYLNDPVTLPWIQRLKILVGAARGIQFLHDPKSTQQRVLHLDVKSSNILLDENWMAKVSDFGLSKLGPASQGHSYLISHTVGTRGYCDPLYMKFGFLTKESDVSSFGVVLFENMCGRLCYEYRNRERSNISVPEWRRCYEKLDEIILPGLKEQMDLGSLRSFAAIAYECVNNAREERPTMAEVVKELEFSLEQQLNLGNLGEKMDQSVDNGATEPE